MRHQTTSTRSGMAQSEIVAAQLEHRDGELLDGVITGTSLVALADGSVDAAERRQLLDFLCRNSLLSGFTRAEILDLFESRTRELRELRAPDLVLDSFGRLAGRSTARFVIEAGEEIAAASFGIHRREQRALELIRIALGLPHRERCAR